MIKTHHGFSATTRERARARARECSPTLFLAETRFSESIPWEGRETERERERERDKIKGREGIED